MSVTSLSTTDYTGREKRAIELLRERGEEIQDLGNRQRCLPPERTYLAARSTTRLRLVATARGMRSSRNTGATMATSWWSLSRRVRTKTTNRAELPPSSAHNHERRG